MTVRAVPLTQGYIAFVDEADYERVMQHKWHIIAYKRMDGSIKRVYAKSKINGRQTYLHRFILRVTDPEVMVDHINGDTLDNRQSNLQFATNQQNQANSHKQADTSSRFKGVSWDNARQKWSAHITVNQRKLYLGRFDADNERGAAVAYNLRAYIEFGDRAHLNDIPPLVEVTSLNF